MGSLMHFCLSALLERYGTQVFVETGTGQGASLLHATRHPFERLYSVEIVESQAAALREEFAGDPRVEIHLGPSVPFLEAVLPAIGDAPILFWLDAHYPGGDLGLNRYDAEADEALRLPLEPELAVIRRLRPGDRDVILIDDLRIYEVGPYTGGNLAGSDLHHLGRYEGIGFVEALFGESHRIERDYADQGYLALLSRWRVTERQKESRGRDQT